MPDLVDFLFLMVEKAGEVLEGALVENRLRLVVGSGDDVADCSQRRRLHLHLPAT